MKRGFKKNAPSFSQSAWRIIGRHTGTQPRRQQTATAPAGLQHSCTPPIWELGTGCLAFSLALNPSRLGWFGTTFATGKVERAARQASLALLHSRKTRLSPLQHVQATHEHLYLVNSFVKALNNIFAMTRGPSLHGSLELQRPIQSNEFMFPRTDFFLVCFSRRLR